MPFSREAEELIRQLRGLAEDPAESRGAGARQLDSLLETCIERYHLGKNTPEETILENWPRIVGKENARRCRPERIDRSGTLVIQVGNATLRRELMFMEDRILTALGSLPDCGHIHRVHLKA